MYYFDCEGVGVIPRQRYHLISPGLGCKVGNEIAVNFSHKVCEKDIRSIATTSSEEPALGDLSPSPPRLSPRLRCIVCHSLLR